MVISQNCNVLIICLFCILLRHLMYFVLNFQWRTVTILSVLEGCHHSSCVLYVCNVLQKIPPSYLRYFFIVLSLFLCREIEILLLSLSPVSWLHKKELLYSVSWMSLGKKVEKNQWFFSSDGKKSWWFHNTCKTFGYMSASSF